MRNFKKTIYAAAVFAVLLLILWGLDFLLYPCTFMRNDIHAVTTAAVDDLYVGTSHGKMNIHPAAAEEVSGRSGHNLCVGGEYSRDVYYMLKLVLEKGTAPKRVIYEISPGYFTTEKEEGNNYLLFYHEFPLSFAKLSYFADTILSCNFRTLLFPWYEYPLSTELAHIKETVQKKASGDYGIETLRSDTQEYHEDGFVERYRVDPRTFTFDGLTEFRTADVKETNMEYLQRVIALCQENGIEFAAVTTPVPLPSLKKFEAGYAQAWEYFGEFFEQEQVPYLNFNDDAYFDLFSHRENNFTDLDGHMHGEAADEFSAVLAEVLEQTSF